MTVTLHRGSSVEGTRSGYIAPNSNTTTAVTDSKGNQINASSYLQQLSHCGNVSEIARGCSNISFCMK